MKKPLSLLGSSVDKNIIATLRNGIEYRGILDGYDPHMNLVLKNADELVEGEKVRHHNIVLVRGDNVIYISP